MPAAYKAPSFLPAFPDCSFLSGPSVVASPHADAPLGTLCISYSVALIPWCVLFNYTPAFLCVTDSVSVPEWAARPSGPGALCSFLFHRPCHVHDDEHPQWTNQCVSILSFFYPEWYIWKNHFSYLSRNSGKVDNLDPALWNQGSKFSFLLKTTFLLGVGGCSWISFFFSPSKCLFTVYCRIHIKKSSLQTVDGEESVGTRVPA